MVILNGTIYTVNNIQPTVQAVVVKSDTIAFLGSETEAKKWISDSTIILDLKGMTMTPGFIDGHAHFLSIGKKLLNLDLSQTRSYSEIVQMVKEKVNSTQPGEWIIGGGWHQDQWNDNAERLMGGFPTHHQLSKISLNNPVFLRHASGHAALANVTVMETAVITKKTLNPDSGEIHRDLTGNATGVLNETAQFLVGKFVPIDTKEKDSQALELAIQECLKNGLTGIHDAGADSSALT
jgi:predicted amidohydrolase YtcJ